MNRKRLLIFGGMLALSAALLTNTLISPATESEEDIGFANFNVGWNVLSGGSGAMNSASFQMQSTLGQPVAALSLSSASFKVCNGYQCGTGTDAVAAATATPTATPTPTPTPTPSGGLANQTITFTPIPNKRTSDAPFGVSATASSGLAVTFSSQTPGTCTVAGNTVTIVAAGNCTIRASQAGNGSFNPATQDYSISIANDFRLIIPMIFDSP
ncbi:MAG: hypothetical protein KIH69_022570 [Anaerolineae bacterium]|nr:hypothetical protein [Anaerolineae bacterium]